MKKYLFLLFLNVSAGFCTQNVLDNTNYWHVNFALNEDTSLPVTFLFENKTLYVLNAEEQIQLNPPVFKNDSIFVLFKAFDSELKARVISSNKIEGKWFNYAKGTDYSIPFSASAGHQSRFPLNESTIDIYGKWEVTFDYDKEPEKAVGIFDADNSTSFSNQVKGTFLTETGDYRYLSGVTSSDSLLLSTFDGSHAFLFQSKLVKDTLWGEFLSGTHYSSKWYAVRNQAFELRHPDSLTYLVNKDPITFELIDSDNNLYTYPNSETENKVTLIQILGTWCPNCLDESNYLKTIHNTYGDSIEIIAVTFETQDTQEERIRKVNNYKTNLDLNYTFLMGGLASKNGAGKLFPMLNNISSFPTLIFIDKKGNTRKIHTGFNGPGTGAYYTDFVNETNSFIDDLIKE